MSEVPAAYRWKVVEDVEFAPYIPLKAVQCRCSAACVNCVAAIRGLRYPYRRLKWFCNEAKKIALFSPACYILSHGLGEDEVYYVVMRDVGVAWAIRRSSNNPIFLNVSQFGIEELASREEAIRRIEFEAYNRDYRSVVIELEGFKIVGRTLTVV